MKATIAIPDELYRRVKAKSALQGQPIREVTINLFQRWVSEPEEPPAGPTSSTDTQRPAWFGAARKYARRVKKHDMAAVRNSVIRGRSGQKSPETP